MTRSEAEKVISELQRFLSSGEVAVSAAFSLEVQALTDLLNEDIFRVEAAKISSEKVMRQSPKKLRKALHRVLVNKADHKAAMGRRTARKKKAPGPKVTNVAFPWQGGAPGSGKRG